MKKRVLIVGGVVVFGIVVALFATGSFGELSSAALRISRPRTLVPQENLAYMSCKKYENIENGYSTLYLASSKKTYATVNGETIDVSDEINLRYFQKQQIALGQADPKKITAIIDYSSGDKFVMQSNFYINGTPITCPSVVIGTMGGEGAEPLPECEQWIQALQEPGIVATCLGKQKFSFQVSDVSLLSSLGEIFPLIPKSYAYTISPSTTEPYTTETPSTTESPNTTEESDTTQPPIMYGYGDKIPDEFRCANGSPYGTAPKPCGCKNGKKGIKEDGVGDVQQNDKGKLVNVKTVTCPEDIVKQNKTKKPKWEIIGGIGKGGLTEDDLREIKEAEERGEKSWDVIQEIRSRTGIRMNF